MAQCTGTVPPQWRPPLGVLFFYEQHLPEEFYSLARSETKKKSAQTKEKIPPQQIVEQEANERKTIISVKTRRLLVNKMTSLSFLIDSICIVECISLNHAPSRSKEKSNSLNWLHFYWIIHNYCTRIKEHIPRALELSMAQVVGVIREFGQAYEPRHSQIDIERMYQHYLTRQRTLARFVAYQHVKL